MPCFFRHLFCCKNCIFQRNMGNYLFYQFSYDHWSQASWAQPVFRWIKPSGGVVSAAVLEQYRRKANMVAQGDGKFGPWGWPQDPSKPKKMGNYLRLTLTISTINYATEALYFFIKHFMCRVKIDSQRHVQKCYLSNAVFPSWTVYLTPVCNMNFFARVVKYCTRSPFLTVFFLLTETCC